MRKSPLIKTAIIKSPARLLFKVCYVILALITTAALATPPAMAANMLPSSAIGALTMISSVAILMTVLVVEIWRQTANNTDPTFQRHMTAARKKRYHF